MLPVLFRRYYWTIPPFKGKQPGLPILIGSQIKRTVLIGVFYPSDSIQQEPAISRIGSLPAGQDKPYGTLIIGRQHVYLRIQSPAGFPQGLFPVFFNAPLASERTFTDAESRETTVIRLFFICSSWSAWKTHSSTLFFARRLILTQTVCQGPKISGRARHLQPFSQI
jgi:hypothetical protein